MLSSGGFRAVRYCGSIAVTIRYLDSTSTYDVTVRTAKDKRRFPAMPGTPEDHRHYARDDPIVLDGIARAALAFAKDEGLDVQDLAVLNEEGFLVITRRRGRR